MPQIIRRGDIWWMEWGGRGSEQTGLRPSLIIQNDAGNDRSNTTIVAAISTNVRTYPFMVRIPASASSLPEDSAVNLSQIMTADRSRLRRRAGSLPKDFMKDVDEAIHISLGLDL